MCQLTFLRLDLACVRVELSQCYLCYFVSPSGKLVQIEYALAAVASGAPSVGIKGLPIICYYNLFLKGSILAGVVEFGVTWEKKVSETRGSSITEGPYNDLSNLKS